MHANIIQHPRRGRRRDRSPASNGLGALLLALALWLAASSARSAEGDVAPTPASQRFALSRSDLRAEPLYDPSSRFQLDASLNAMAPKARTTQALAVQGKLTSAYGGCAVANALLADSFEQ